MEAARVYEEPHSQGVKFRLDEIIRAILRDQAAFTPQYDDVSFLLQKALPMFERDPSLVEISPPAMVVGDLRGSIVDLVRAYSSIMGKDERPRHFTVQFTFLGNYIGGAHSVHVLMLLFALKARCPRSVILLRGNHEVRFVSDAYYEFKGELQQRFSENQAADLLERFNEVFDHMPLACLIGGKVLCVHGGISPELETLDDIRKIPKPLKHPERPLPCDLLWADFMWRLEGFIRNTARERSVYFGKDVLEATLRRLGVKYMIRGHEIIYKGNSFVTNLQKEVKMITLTTATDVHNGNYAALLVVQGDCSPVLRLLNKMNQEFDIADYRKNDHRADYEVYNDYAYPAETVSDPSMFPDRGYDYRTELRRVQMGCARRFICESDVWLTYRGPEAETPEALETTEEEPKEESKEEPKEEPKEELKEHRGDFIIEMPEF